MPNLYVVSVTGKEGNSLRTASKMASIVCRELNDKANLLSVICSNNLWNVHVATTSFLRLTYLCSHILFSGLGKSGQ